MGTWFSGTGERFRREIAGILLLGLAVFGFAALLGDGSGSVGEVVRLLLSTLFGSARYAVPGLIAVFGIIVLLGRDVAALRRRLWGALIAFLAVVALLHRGTAPEQVFTQGRAGLGGGLLGGGLSWVLLHTVGPSGRTIVIIMASIVALVLVTGLSVVAVSGSFLQGGASLLRRSWAWLVSFVSETVDEEQTPSAAPAGGPPALPAGGSVGTVFVDDGTAASSGGSPEPTAGDDDYWSNPQAALHGPRVVHHAAAEGQHPTANGTTTMGEKGRPAKVGGPGADDQAAVASSPQPAAPAPRPRPYQPPPLTLLQPGRSLRAKGPGRSAVNQAGALEETLASFGVKTRVIGIQQGPAVTRYELQLAKGIKVSRVQNLANDIALSLAATDVRIEAPIPGKSAVGIEVPNREITAVALRDVLATPEFQDKPSPLAFAVGQDIAGQPVVTHLDGLLHVLIAGATGSGKSVCISSLLASLLCKAGPEQVRLLLIDPKVVELSGYNGIPHLLVPVITDPRRAAAALQWLVREMERRYEAFAEAGTRDIGSYNNWLVGSGEPVLPYIVVVIDELADLMLVAPVDVEDAIQRLAQMARAAGIHLVVATQRPSVDVITGVIKANIPSRIAFAVASQTDSRVILDMAGAEKLVGKGDMLFFPIGASKPIRVQGCYVTEAELRSLQDYVRRQAEPQYDEAVLAAAQAGEAATADESDELFPEAVRIVVEAGQASVSLLQRRLRVGYTRAGRLVDMMEQRGFVGPHIGSRARELRLTIEQYRRLFEGGDEDAGEAG